MLVFADAAAEPDTETVLRIRHAIEARANVLFLASTHEALAAVFASALVIAKCVQQRRIEREAEKVQSVQ